MSAPHWWDDYDREEAVEAGRELVAEMERLREKCQHLAAELQRVRDWLKCAANSEGGIVAEIEWVLQEAKE